MVGSVYEAVSVNEIDGVFRGAQFFGHSLMKS